MNGTMGTVRLPNILVLTFDDFVSAQHADSGYKYSEVMIDECATLGMKPVCSDASWCQQDEHALYVGLPRRLCVFVFFVPGLPSMLS